MYKSIDFTSTIIFKDIFVHYYSFLQFSANNKGIFGYCFKNKSIQILSIVKIPEAVRYFLRLGPKVSIPKYTTQTRKITSI